MSVQNQSQRWSEGIYNRSRKQPYSKRASRIALVIGTLFVMGLVWFMGRKSGLSERELSEKETIVMNNRKIAVRALPTLKQEITIPENPYSFYDQLEKRTFVFSGEDQRGGTEYRESIPIPQFTLISASEESGFNSSDDGDFSLPPLQLLSHNDPLEEQGSSGFDVVAEKVSKAPPKGPSPRNFKTLQTGSFLALAEANAQRKQLEAHGYNPQIIRAEKDGRPLFRVHVGPFSINELESVKSDLKGKRFDFFEVR